MMTYKSKKLYVLRVLNSQHYYIGYIDGDDDEWIELKSGFFAIEDSGRFIETLKTGSAHNTFQIDGRIAIRLSMLIDIIEWPHALPPKAVA